MKGMVRQRGKMWTAYWWTPNPVTGDWTQRSKGGFATKTTAQKHFTATLAKVHIGEWSPESKLTVRELLTDHIGSRLGVRRDYGRRRWRSIAT